MQVASHKDHWRLRSRLAMQRCRDGKSECIGPSLQDLIAMLCLLGAPYPLIVSIAEVKARGMLKLKLPGPWTPDLVKRLSRQALARRPNMVSESETTENPLTLKATRWLVEARLAMWCSEQSCKQIAVPSSVLRLKYIEMWGIGPHTETATAHLSTFRDPTPSTKIWMTRFRQHWQLTYGRCAPGSWMPKELAQEKVRSAHLSPTKTRNDF